MRCECEPSAFRRHGAAFDMLRLTQDGVTPGLDPGLSKRDANTIDLQAAGESHATGLK